MPNNFYFSFVSLLFTSSLMAPAARAGEQVNWRPNPRLAAVLASIQDPALAIDGSLRPDDIDFDRTTCAASVYRPHENEGIVRRADNHLRCSVVHDDGTTAQVELSMEDFPIESWGSVVESHPFQIKDHAWSTLLYEALADYNRTFPADELVDEIRIAGPDGFLNIAYSLDNQADPDGAAHLICSTDYQWDTNVADYVAYRNRCVFMPTID